jgi:hypothetical protein
MKSIFAASVLAAGIMLAPTTAGAGERLGGAALGASPARWFWVRWVPLRAA